MPYTPPSHNSPVASKTHSPSLTRSHSYVSQPLSAAAGSAHRVELPRSTSYLSRHRRTPSFTPHHSAALLPQNPPAQHLPSKPSDLPKVVTYGIGDGMGNGSGSGSLHQSPAPVNDSLIPSGAIISPPDSSHNSSDEDEASGKHKGRKLDNLAELQAAIRVIGQQPRDGSPDRKSSDTNASIRALDLVMPASRSLFPERSSSPEASRRLPLSKEARKISHSRSNTESSILFDLVGAVPRSPRSNSDEDSDLEDDDLRMKPPMVRKKSGELVKPALRPTSSRRRPSSMPGTPTYSKAVHFDSHLEHVRHFLQVDRPLAVSAGSSPVELYESEGEFPFGEDAYRSRPAPFQWEITLSNFPRPSRERSAMPVEVERVFLSSDNKMLIGTVAVANLAFNKTVVARFTLDYWKTTSEVVAEFNNDVRREQANDGRDRFNFNIKLADQANLENKTLFFCVRYNVNGQEYWDSNGTINFQVDFSKKSKPQKGKNGPSPNSSRPLKQLPRSSPLPNGRPKSMPASFDDFADGFDHSDDFASFRQPATKLMGESSPTALRFKNAPPAKGAVVQSSPVRRNVSAGQAFGNRYDFGASLSAAIQAANTTVGDRSGLKAGEQSSQSAAKVDGGKELNRDASASIPPASSSAIPHFSGKASTQPTNAPTGWPSQTRKSATLHGTGRPESFPSSTGKPSLLSSSYHELLDKYCFFGTAKVSSLNSLAGRQLDGACDEIQDASQTPPSSPSQVVSRASSEALPECLPESLPNSPASSPATSSLGEDEMISIPTTKPAEPRLSRSPSPSTATGGVPLSRVAQFGYPYHGMNGGFNFAETHTPTAILG
ncbi:MAG: hypothetical protein M1829_005731 [Trizodia sp. TS-e1964]|nr:MAG: hypothetical protein M1829_005731 [Trizodia sp. TS-e1964]